MLNTIGALALTLASASVPSRAKAPEPRGGLAGVFTADDYPSEALNKNEQGDVHIAVDVDATGTASNCVIEKSSNSPVLDKRTCDLIRERATFKPALDRNGRPIASKYRQTIHWRVATDLMPSEPWASREVIDYGPFGDAVSCHFDLEGAIKPKPGTPLPHCASSDMTRTVGRDDSLGGAVDRIILEERFTPQPESTQQLGADELILGKEVFQLDIDATGKLLSCKLAERTGPPAKIDLCTRVRKQYIVRNGVDGKAARFSATEAFTTIAHIDRSRPPVGIPDGSLQALFTADDYPPDALDHDEQGKVGIVIRTDAKGLVIDCVVEESSKSQALDKRTCDVVRQRAKFKPALNLQGRPVAGEYRVRISWNLEDELTPSDAWVARTVINFAPDGRPLSCHMDLEGAMAPKPGATTPTCGADALANVPSKVADLPGAIATIVMEQRFAIGRVPAAPIPPGDVLVTRSVMSLDIGADGKLTSCKVIESSGQEPSFDPCSAVDKAYAPHNGPDGKPVSFNATATFTIYVHVEKVAFGAAVTELGQIVGRI